ncbi:coq1 putative hexaprenyl diphosphate synthase [Gaertneriomyces sp. JEL0708]|nr:coq1 putative hexaprenyl diphosphate synthase [Gaertneriomyces sp. JEL0708]
MFNAGVKRAAASHASPKHGSSSVWRSLNLTRWPAGPTRCARLASSCTSAMPTAEENGSSWVGKRVLNIKSKIVKSALPEPSATPTSQVWSAAMSSAEALVHPTGGSVINPRELLGKDLTVLTDNIRRLLGSGHPVLTTISNYYFHAGGKHVRPLIVLLISQATSVAPKMSDFGTSISATTVDEPTTSSTEITFENGDETAADRSGVHILPTQRRLAEITEMIHTASLLHDDVIDVAMTRRSQTSANAEFGNKMAILAGDFLLARASVALARLRNVEVVELLATVISNLVEGEFMQLRNSALDGEKSWLHHAKGMLRASQDDALNGKFEYYMEKTYLKTASLIAKSCRAAAVLGGCTEDIAEAAYNYGKSLGLAFQLVDDMLDFTVSADEFGKPVNADLKLGLATAPVLFAAEQYQELYPLIERNFNQDGDVATALKLVLKSDGIPRTRALAESYCAQAINAINQLPPTDARTALIQLTEAVLTRNK